LDSNNIFDKFGRVQVEKIDMLPLHQYTKEALRRIEYKNYTGSLE
jgi:hypothetical protein